MKINVLSIIILTCLFTSCKEGNGEKSKVEVLPAFQNEGHKLVYNMVEKVGDYDQLSRKRSVEYIYTYQTPDNKTDVSSEKYMFEGELSYGKYTQHERTFPELEGIIEQGFDGEEFWLKHNGEVISDEKRLKRVAFNRPTNFYWFAMMQKLLDPGLNYEYLGEMTIDSQEYDIVKVSFNSATEEPTDIYQLYINKKTSLVDQFLFTVVDFGKVDTPNLMKLKYEEIEGIMIPTQRRYKQSTWNADIDEKPWINVTWSDVKFDTGITREDFKKNRQFNVSEQN